MTKTQLQDAYNVKLVRTRESFDSHRTYWEIWSHEGELMFDAWTLQEAKEKLEGAHNNS